MLMSNSYNSLFFFTVCTVALYVFSFSNHLQAQDNELWQGISLESEIADGLTLRLDDQLRLENNVSDFQLNLFNLEATYKVTPYFRLYSGYRYSILPVVNRNRLYVGGLLRKEVDAIQTEFRLYTQYQYEFDKKEVTSSYLRPKAHIQFEPKGKKIEPFIAAELFYRLSSEPDADLYRLYAGLDYELTGRNTLRFMYARETWIEGQDANIYSLGFIMDIQTWKKKKDKKEKESEIDVKD